MWRSKAIRERRTTFKVGAFVFVFLVHGFGHDMRDIDVGDVLVAFVEHFLAQS
jgi:hypothetical protein